MIIVILLKNSRCGVLFPLCVRPMYLMCTGEGASP